MASIVPPFQKCRPSSNCHGFHLWLETQLAGTERFCGLHIVPGYEGKICHPSIFPLYGEYKCAGIDWRPPNEQAAIFGVASNTQPFLCCGQSSAHPKKANSTINTYIDSYVDFLS